MFFGWYVDVDESPPMAKEEMAVLTDTPTFATSTTAPSVSPAALKTAEVPPMNGLELTEAPTAKKIMRAVG